MKQWLGNTLKELSTATEPERGGRWEQFAPWPQGAGWEEGRGLESSSVSARPAAITCLQCHLLGETFSDHPIQRDPLTHALGSSAQCPSSSHTLHARFAYFVFLSVCSTEM